MQQRTTHTVCYKLPYLESCTHTDLYTYKSNVYITVKGVSQDHLLYIRAPAARDGHQSSTRSSIEHQLHEMAINHRPAAPGEAQVDLFPEVDALDEIDAARSLLALAFEEEIYDEDDLLWLTFVLDEEKFKRLPTSIGQEHSLT